MKAAWKTTEFWAALITNGIGLAVLFGGLTAEQGDVVGGELKTIAGAVIAILTSLGYIGVRGAVKLARARALAAGRTAPELAEAGL
jgi:uncharacterized membrane protein YhaH (DUF805 family)